MNRLNSIALLAGGALVAVAAAGCSSSAKPAASAPAPSSASTANAPSTTATGASNAPSTAASSTAPNAGSSSTSAPSGGGSTTAPAGSASSTTAPESAAPTGHPVCGNAQLNASLAPRIAGQAASIAVIAVKNAGPTCAVGPIPYVWIVTSPTDVSNETRPLIPSVDTSAKNIILSGTTVYAAIDLNPGSKADAPDGYGYLEVTANPTKDTGGKDVQDVQLFEPSKVANAKLGVWADNPSLAISSIQYATTPEQ